MALYQVYVYRDADVTIEANSKEEAIQMASKMSNEELDKKLNSHGYEIGDADEI